MVPTRIAHLGVPSRVTAKTGSCVASCLSWLAAAAGPTDTVKHGKDLLTYSLPIGR